MPLKPAPQPAYTLEREEGQMPDEVRKEVVFTGRVQGVGFRYTTRSLARNYAVTGFVRNVPDGTVELVAEGLPREVDAFILALKDRMGGYIREAREEDAPPSGAYDGFEIAF